MTLEIIYKEVTFQVEFNHQPFERAETGPEAQYPGCGESIELIDIIHEGDSFLEVFENEIDKIEEAILKKMDADAPEPDGDY